MSDGKAQAENAGQDVQQNEGGEQQTDNKWQDYTGKYGGAAVAACKIRLGCGVTIDYERSRYTHRINGVALQDLLTPFRIGRWCSETESNRLGGPGIAWDTDREAWFRWRASRWERLPEMAGRCRGAEIYFCARYQDLLIDWATEIYYTNTKPGQFNRVAILRERCFHTDEFLAGAREHLARQLGETDKRNLATPFGRLYISRAGLELHELNRNRDNHMQASRVTLGKKSQQAWLRGDDRGITRVARLFATWFPDDGIDDAGTSYVQRLLGAAVIGKLPKAFLVLRGATGAGKSLLLRLLETALGELCISTRGDVFSDKDPNDYLSRLIDQQPRLVLLNEYGTRSLTAVALNRLTGGDTMIAAAKYQTPISGRVDAVPILAQETLPRFTGATRGTIDRQIVLEMSKPAARDPNLMHEAADPQSELARGMLAWICKGGVAIEDQDSFLELPVWVSTAMLSAREEQDRFGAWLIDMTAWISEGGKTARQIYDAYVGIPENREYEDGQPDRFKMTAQKVGMRMHGYGFELVRTKTARLWFPA